MSAHSEDIGKAKNSSFFFCIQKYFLLQFSFCLKNFPENVPIRLPFESNEEKMLSEKKKAKPVYKSLPFVLLLPSDIYSVSRYLVQVPGVPHNTLYSRQ